MYRDPSEFRERFKLYKEGKSVREIYGLPGYEPGKIGEPSPDEVFVDTMGPLTYRELLYQGVDDPDTVYNYMMHQMAHESNHGRSRVAKEQNNYGGVGWNGSTYFKYNSRADFLHYYVKLMNSRYKEALKAKSLKDYVYGIKKLKYFEDKPETYYASMAGMKSLEKAMAAHRAANPELYKIDTVPIQLTKPIIAIPDATKVSTIPTIQQQAIDYSDRRNAVAAETERAIWARNVMDSLQEGYKVPVWESPSLPVLLPVEMDVVPFKTYSNGKLPGYLGGKEATIQQGRKQLPIDKAEAATEPDYNEGWLLTTLKRGANNFIKTVKDQVRSARNIVNGRGDWFDWLNVGTDVVLGAGGKAVKGAAREAKAAVKAIKPKKSSVKFNTKDPNKIGAYYTAHPEEVTPITNSEELNDVVNFINTHIAPKYARQNKVHIGIDPADIKLGSADLSGTNLGGYVGPSGEVVINQDILNNSDMLRRVLGHEVVGHWLDLHYPLTPAQASIVLNGVRFNADFLNSRPWFDLFAEGNAERRLFNYLSSRDNGNVVGSELDAIINSMPRAQAKRYADMLGYNKGIEWQWPDILPFKQAATSVPTIGIPLYAGTLIDRLYNNGKLPGYYEGELPMGEKKQLTDEEVRLAAYASPHELPLSPADPVMEKFVEIVGGGKFLKLLKGAFAEQLIRNYKRSYKEARLNGWGRSTSKFIAEEEIDNPALNILNKELKILDLFNNGKLPGYSNGKIRIKPSKRGTFTAAAKKHGASVREFESRVLKNPEKYSKAMVKKAQFSHNARSWKH